MTTATSTCIVPTYQVPIAIIYGRLQRKYPFFVEIWHIRGGHFVKKFEVFVFLVNDNSKASFSITSVLSKALF